VAGPSLFVLAFVLEGMFRPGYSPARDTVSVLDLSGQGWQQIASFLVTGVLMVVFAAGARRAVPAGPASRWGPRLLALTGAGLILSGAFIPDATRGYPPGTPPGPASGSSWHNTVHGLGALLWIVSASASGFVFARYFLRQRRPLRATHAITSGIIVLASFLLSFSASTQATGFLASNGGLIERISGIAAMTWLVILSLQLLAATARSRGRGLTLRGQQSPGRRKDSSVPADVSDARPRGPRPRSCPP
jgi:hypothetical membrane protein